MALKPSFAQLWTSLMCGVPERISTSELKCEDYIKGQFLGRELPALAEDPRGYFECDVEFHQRAGYGTVRVAPTLNFGERWLQATHAYAVGSSEQRQRNWATTHVGVIQTEDDLDRFPWPDPAAAPYDWLDLVAGMLPPDMELATSLKGGGIFERAWMLMGFEAFGFAVMERPDFVRRLIDRIGSIYLAFLERAFEHPRVRVLWLGDDLAYYSGTMVRPDFLRSAVFPWYERIGRLCTTGPLPRAFVFHSDGNLWEVLEDLISVGVKALHPIEPKAWDIVEVKRHVAGRLCLIGNIDLGYTLTRGTPEEVRQEVRERIAQCGPDGYVVSSSNSVTEYVPLENYRAMLAAVEEFGTVHG